MTIYILKNFTLQEVYFGIAEGDLRSAVNEHKNNPDSPVGHWQFDSEKIQWGEVEKDLSEAYGRAFLQALRREPPDEGWVVVVGMD